MRAKAHKSIPAGKFKAQCLSLLDRVARTGEPLIVTKRGRPVAKVVPVDGQAAPALLGSVVVKGDIVGPILDEWEIEG
jgi:prevent-host-death family protein